jgi:hypothetical protein
MDKDAVRAEMTEAMACLWEAAEGLHNAGMVEMRDEANNLADAVREMRNKLDLA